MEYLVTWLYVIVKNAGFVSERFLKNFFFLFHYMSRYMTKPTQWVCVQRRLRSAWASAQSDQSLHYPHEEILGPYLPNERTAKTLMTDQTGRMSRLIWVFAGRILIVLVLSCRGSYYHYFRMVYSPAVTLYILLRLNEKVRVKTEQQRNNWKLAFKFNIGGICK